MLHMSMSVHLKIHVVRPQIFLEEYHWLKILKHETIV
jgi:hypothetical protein